MVVSAVDLLYVFGRSFVLSDVTPLVQFGGNQCGDLVSVLQTRDVSYGSTEYYIGLYTRLTCVHVEPAHLTPSTAPPLPCEAHPAQKPSIKG